MSAREILAYAITHAPPGVKGGPYEAESGVGRPVPTLTEAWRKRSRVTVRRWLRAVRRHVPTARVIRIVRARPSEASAVEVLREVLTAVDDWDADRFPMSRLHAVLMEFEASARRVLAASGPDPSEVVRAAMRETEAEEAFDRVALKGRSMNAAADAIGVARANRVEAVDAYRKAGGK